MRKLLLLAISILFFGGIMAQNAITIHPANATAYELVTIYLDATKSCPDGALFNADSVMMHSGVTVNGQAWQKVVAFDGTGINGQKPKLVKYVPPVYPVTISPSTATAWDEITLTLNANISCPEGALLAADSVMMHSGVTINGQAWQNVVAFDGTGADGKKPKLTSNGDGTWSITFTPAAFYNIPVGSDVTAINCVFNAGAWSAGEGKAFDENGGCVDFVVPFMGPPTGDHIWMISYVPALFYGLNPTTDVVTAIDCVFNAGDWSAGEGKDYDENGNCVDFKIPLTVPVPQIARVQIIHNSADLAAAAVDIWLNDLKVLDDFGFRQASPFLSAPAGLPLSIGIKGSDSVDPTNPIYSQVVTLEADKTYIFIANGIVSPSGYDPNVPFSVFAYDTGRETSSVATNCDVLVFHGSTDAPTVDIYEVAGTPTEIANDVAYGAFAGYLELPAANYSIQVRDGSGTAEVATFAAPLGGLAGQAITVLASGFLTPANNSNGPLFGLYVATPAGGALLELEKTSSVETLESKSLKVYPNPAQNVLFIEILQDATRLEIVNVIGEKVMAFDNLTNDKLEINTSNLTTGVYLINLYTETGVQSMKFLKK